MSAFDDPHTDGVFVSTDPKLLDLVWIVRTLRESYWGNWRSLEVVSESMRHSLCFGLYTREYADTEDGPPIGCVDRQIGFARAISDQFTFTEICDVVVDEKYRGKGYGKFLLRTMIQDPRIAKTVMHLATRDAHALYARFGFKPVDRMKRNFF